MWRFTKYLISLFINIFNIFLRRAVQPSWLLCWGDRSYSDWMHRKVETLVWFEPGSKSGFWTHHKLSRQSSCCLQPPWKLLLSENSVVWGENRLIFLYLQVQRRWRKKRDTRKEQICSGALGWDKFPMTDLVADVTQKQFLALKIPPLPLLHCSCGAALEEKPIILAKLFKKPLSCPLGVSELCFGPTHEVTQQIFLGPPKVHFFLQCLFFCKRWPLSKGSPCCDVTFPLASHLDKSHGTIPWRNAES